MISLLCLWLVTLCTSLATEAPASVGHDLFDSILQDRVRAGAVDYGALKTDPRLERYLAALAEVDPATLNRSNRLAHWINAYNALTLKLMTDSWPVESIRNINNGKPWDVPLFLPKGFSERLSLNQIEHEIIRKQFTEPRVHFALVCAAVSCPPLRSEAYQGPRLSAQLADQTTQFLRNPARNRYDARAHSLSLSPLFNWYAVDFGGAAGVPSFVAKYLATTDRDAMARFSRPPSVVFSDYDWAPNTVR